MHAKFLVISFRRLTNENICYLGFVGWASIAVWVSDSAREAFFPFGGGTRLFRGFVDTIAYSLLQYILTHELRCGYGS